MASYRGDKAAALASMQQGAQEDNGEATQEEPHPLLPPCRAQLSTHRGNEELTRHLRITHSRSSRFNSSLQTKACLITTQSV
jgi:hypothetical protein